MPISNKENLDFETKVVQESPVRSRGDSPPKDTIMEEHESPSQGNILSQRQEVISSQDGFKN
jgi:hypothetical protein